MDNASLPPTSTCKPSIAPSQYGFSSGANLCAGISIPQPHLPRLLAVHNFVARDQRTVRTYSVKELGSAGAACRPSIECDSIRLPPPCGQLHRATAMTDLREGVSSPLSPTSAHEVRHDPGWCVSSVQSQSGVQSGNPSCSSVKNVGFLARTLESPASGLRLSRATVDGQCENAAPVNGHQVLAPASVKIHNPEKQVLWPRSLLNAAVRRLVQGNHQGNIVYQERPLNFLSEVNAVTSCQHAFSHQGNSLQQHSEPQSSCPASSPESRLRNLMAFLRNRKHRRLAVSFARPPDHDLPVDTSSPILSNIIRGSAAQEVLQPVGVTVMGCEKAISTNPANSSLYQNLRKLYHFTRHASKLPVSGVETARACASPFQEVIPADMNSLPDPSVKVSLCPAISREVVLCSQNKLQHLANPAEKAFDVEQNRWRSHDSTSLLNSDLSRTDVEPPIEWQQPLTSIGSLVGFSTCNSSSSATSNYRLGLSCSFLKNHRKRKLEFIDLTVSNGQISDNESDLSMLPGTRLFSSDKEGKDTGYLLGGNEYTERSSSGDHSNNVRRSFELDVALHGDLIHLSEKDMPPLSLMEEMNDICADTKAAVDVSSPMLTEQLYHREHSAYDATDQRSEAQPPSDAHLKEGMGVILDDSVEVRNANSIAPLIEDDKQKSCLQNVKRLYNEDSGHLSSSLGETMCDQPGITTSIEKVVGIDSTSSNSSSYLRLGLKDTLSLRSQPSFQPVVLLERLPDKVLKEATSGANVLTEIGFQAKRVRNLSDLLDSADFESTCEDFEKAYCDGLDSEDGESSSDSCSDLASLLELKDLSNSDDSDESNLCPAGMQERSTKPHIETTGNASLSGFERGRASKLPRYSADPVQPFQMLINRSNQTSRSPTLCDPNRPTLGTDSPNIGRRSLKRNVSEKILDFCTSNSPQDVCTKRDQNIVSTNKKLGTPSTMLLDDAGVHAASSLSDADQHTGLGIPNSKYQVKSKLGGRRSSYSVDAGKSDLNHLKGNRLPNTSHQPLRIFDGSKYHKRLLEMKRRGAGKKLRRTLVSVHAEKSTKRIKQKEDSDHLSAGLKSETQSNLRSGSMQLYRLGGVQVKPVGKVSLRVEAQGRRYARVSLVGVNDKCDRSSLDKPPSNMLSSLQTRSLAGTS